VSSSEAVSCYIPPSCEDEVLEQFSNNRGAASQRVSGCWDTLWDTRRKELAAYKQQNNGSTNVPQHYLPNQPLANWVQTQRNLTKLFQDGKTSAMTSERIESLNELDFKWGYVQSTVWDTRRKELATYKQQNNGRTNVPQRFLSNKPLGIWVQKQRHQYKLLKDLKKSSMTTVRIKSLNELDFEWNPILHNRK